MTTKKFLGTVIIVLGFYFLYANLLYERDLKTAVDPASTESIPVLIASGSSLEKVAEDLEKFELIRRKKAFVRYGKKQEKQVLAGRFFLNQAMTIPDLWSMLTDPSKAELVLTIPEGFSSKEIDRRLKEIGLFREGELLQTLKNLSDFSAYPLLDPELQKKLPVPLEGSLFPDTYFLSPSEKPIDVVTRLYGNFEGKMKEHAIPKDTARSLHEILIVASMLEKEIKTAEDLPMVAGIIWKRLDNGWFLNIDATALYDPTYDTYKKKGLPPGPIGNPGLKTIQAALNPKETPYWYYLTKPETGEVVYAKTNEEQNRNRAKYLK